MSEKDDKEVSSATKTLKEIVETFAKAQEKSESIRLIDSGQENSHISQEETEADAGFAHKNCIFCNKNLGKLEFIMCLECCGAPAHITCISEQKNPICPVCKSQISECFCNLCRKLSRYVPDT